MNSLKIYFAPYNDSSLICKESLEKKEKFNFLGFIDKEKKGDEIIQPNQLLDKNFDKVIISSSGYFKQIYNEYILLGVPKSKIFFYFQKTDMLINNIYQYYFYNYMYKSKPIIDNKIIDFELYFGANRKKLLKYKNIHLDKRAFIIGNGPSLNVKDINTLKDEITFAANKIYLMFNETQWRPTYYFVEDDLVFKQNYETIKNIDDTVKFFPTFLNKYHKTINNAIYYRLNFKPHAKNFPQISTNPFSGFYWGSTVIYSMIQMAIYMGIKEIYLIGIDFSFDIPKNFSINSANRKDLISEGELNHFHKDYRKVDEKWNLPNLEIQLKAFEKAKNYCKKHNIKIYNASKISKLEIFDKISIF